MEMQVKLASFLGFLFGSCFGQLLVDILYFYLKGVTLYYGDKVISM